MHPYRTSADPDRDERAAHASDGGPSLSLLLVVALVLWGVVHALSSPDMPPGREVAGARTAHRHSAH